MAKKKTGKRPRLFVTLPSHSHQQAYIGALPPKSKLVLHDMQIDIGAVVLRELREFVAEAGGPKAASGTVGIVFSVRQMTDREVAHLPEGG